MYLNAALALPRSAPLRREKAKGLVIRRPLRQSGHASLGVNLLETNLVSGQAGSAGPTPKSWPVSIFGNILGQYMVDLEIGTPPQTFSVALDTGSVELWVNSAVGPAGGCGTAPQFNPGNSSTFQLLPGSFNHSYVDSTIVQGMLGQDVVELGELKVVRQPFGLSLCSLSTPSTSILYDGVLGLAPTATSSSNVTSFLQNLVFSKQLAANVFSTYMARESPGGPFKGEVIFGGYDPSKYVGELVWLATNTTVRYWRLTAQQVTVGTTRIPQRPMALDTGSSTILLPVSDSIAIHRALNATPYNSQRYLVSCETRLSLPSVTIRFNGIAVVLRPEDYSFEATTDAGPICGTYFETRDIVPGESLWVLGVPFHNRVYAVYDYGRQRVAIAPVASLATL